MQSAKLCVCERDALKAEDLVVDLFRAVGWQDAGASAGRCLHLAQRSPGGGLDSGDEMRSDVKGIQVHKRLANSLIWNKNTHSDPKSRARNSTRKSLRASSEPGSLRSGPQIRAQNRSNVLAAYPPMCFTSCSCPWRRPWPPKDTHGPGRETLSRKKMDMLDLQLQHGRVLTNLPRRSSLDFCTH